MVKQFLSDQVGLTDLSRQEMQTMAAIWDAKNS
jgi:hypothetical protein